MRRLSEALYRTMADTPIEQATITGICERAGMSRRTFYRHCTSKLDLVDYLMDLMIRDNVENVDYSSLDAASLYEDFFRYWRGRGAFLAITLGQGLFPRFSMRFTDYCVRRMDHALLQDFLDGKPRQAELRLFYNAFIMGGLCSVLERWTAEGFSTPVETLAGVLVSLAPAAGGTPGKDPEWNGAPRE